MLFWGGPKSDACDPNRQGWEARTNAFAPFVPEGASSFWRSVSPSLERRAKRPFACGLTMLGRQACSSVSRKVWGTIWL